MGFLSNWKRNREREILAKEEKIPLEELRHDPYFAKKLREKDFKEIFGKEGKNVDENGNEYWQCGQHTEPMRFDSVEDYEAHHRQNHN